MSYLLHREVLSRPGEPTDAPPGSRRKIRVLMERAARRESLFHPNDNLVRLKLDREPDPEEPLLELDGDLINDLEPIADFDDEEDEEIEIEMAG